MSGSELFKCFQVLKEKYTTYENFTCFLFFLKSSTIYLLKSVSVCLRTKYQLFAFFGFSFSYFYEGWKGLYCAQTISQNILSPDVSPECSANYQPHLIISSTCSSLVAVYSICALFWQFVCKVLLWFLYTLLRLSMELCSSQFSDVFLIHSFSQSPNLQSTEDCLQWDYMRILASPKISLKCINVYQRDYMICHSI